MQKNIKSLTLTKSLRPLYYICSIVGLAPWVLTKSKIHTKNSIVIPKTILIFFTYILIFYLICKSTKLGAGTTLLDLVIKIHDTIWCLCTILFIIIEFVNRQQILKFFQKLLTFEKLFYYQNLQKSLFKMNVLFFTGLLLCFSIVGLSVYFDFIIYFRFEPKMFFACLFFYNAFISTVGVFVLKFVTLNFLVTEFFKGLNRSLDFGGTNLKVRSQILNSYKI